MKTRHYFLIIICFLFVTCAGGIYFRTTLSPLDWDSVKECARVGILQDEIAVDTIENMATSLENQNVILAVECLEEPQILYKNIIQKVRVKKCFQGTVESLYFMVFRKIPGHIMRKRTVLCFQVIMRACPMYFWKQQRLGDR